jgi:type I restriction-modification system DNA methylase subunit
MTYNAGAKRYEVTPAYRSFLSEHALRSLRTASLTAFYTPLAVITTIWDALLQRGLADIAEPRILEPAAGVGAFLTAMPPALRARARITAIELDRCAALMSAQIHPDITLHAGLGYETINLPDASFDLAISNVPFGAIPVLDRELSPAFTRTIHDYCALRRA